MDQFDPWHVIPRQAFTPYSRLLISAAFVVVCICIGCLGITGVHTVIQRFMISQENRYHMYSVLRWEIFPSKRIPKIWVFFNYFVREKKKN